MVISQEAAACSMDTSTRLPYDGFHIPLADGAIDRVACFDAFHHVPNKRTVLRELYRVLRNGGRACFVEPGPGHASSQEAVEEARSWGVLEDEVDAPELCRLAKEVGFESSYIVPLPPLSDNALEPGAFQAIRESDRRGVLDWTGNDALIVLGKLLAGVKDSRSPGILAADLEVVNCPDVVDPGEIIVAELTVTNVGDTTWLALRPQASKRPLDYASAFLNKSVSPGDRSLGISVALYREYLDEHDLGGAVAIGAQLWPGAGLQAIDSDYGRGFFSEDVAPGCAVRATIRMRAPYNGGLYCLKFDAVAEYLTWFSATGSAAEHHYFTVRGDRAILDSRAPGRLSAHIRVVEQTGRGKLVVSITNAGDTVWLANPLRSGGWVQLGVQALDDEGAVTDRDWRRVRLPNDVVPGDSVSLRLDLSDAPPSLNRARLDLVSELRCWFEEQEATPVTIVL